jgi:hypothetical protein
MNTLAQPLAAYCSHGNHYKSFRTEKGSVQSDVDRLLFQFGAPADVRARVQALLASSETHFPAGFRYESTYDHTDPQRTVVYASLPIPMLDGDKEPAFKEEETAEEFVTRTVGAWRRCA